ncbi:MAG: polysaccharide biosynthesis/export family protein [Chlamydiia bacterium]|nr:polysaccharide biosynthesis/export family protein [Chlamydiia bacterium]
MAGAVRLFLLISFSLFAQDSCTLQPGDELTLGIYGQENTERTCTVDPKGNISYLFLHNYPAKGKEVATLRKELENSLGNYFRDPSVLVSLRDTPGETFSIVGEVNEPGVKPLLGRTTVVSALAMAGGIPIRMIDGKPTELVDFNRAFLARDGDYVPVDFERLVRYGDTRYDVLLQKGDYIYIPNLETSQIFILGEVYSPLTLETVRPVTLTEAIAKAGGLTEIAGMKVAVVRGSLACPTRYLVDLCPIWQGCASDFILESGDIVYVPEYRYFRLIELGKLAARAFVSAVTDAAATRIFYNFWNDHHRGSKSHDKRNRDSCDHDNFRCIKDKDSDRFTKCDTRILRCPPKKP